MLDIKTSLPLLNKSDTNTKIHELESTKSGGRGRGGSKYTQMKSGMNQKSIFSPWRTKYPSLGQGSHGAHFQVGLKIFFQNRWDEEPFYFNPWKTLFKDNTPRAVLSGLAHSGDWIKASSVRVLYLKTPESKTAPRPGKADPSISQSSSELSLCRARGASGQWLEAVLTSPWTLQSHSRQLWERQ